MGHDAPLYIFSEWFPAIPITSKSTQLERDRFYAKVTGVRANAYANFDLPSYERCFYTYSVQTIRSTSIEMEITELFSPCPLILFLNRKYVLVTTTETYHQRQQPTPDSTTGDILRLQA